MRPQPTVLARPEVIEVPVPAYRPLPETLTAPLRPPAPPPRRCRHADGSAAVCLVDALAVIPQWKALLDLANQDRARAALLGSTDGTR